MTLPSVNEGRAWLRGRSPASFEAADLECVRGDRVLFSGFSFRIDEGEVLQVEGANGSGKTTLLRVLCGFITPASGVVRWCGTDIRAARPVFNRDVNYVGHAPGVKDHLTAIENLRVTARLGAPRAGAPEADVLARLGLAGYEDSPARTLSAGQRRRVALARLLLSEARLWLLDEPFTALDSDGRGLVEEMLEEHAMQGGITVLTTHHSLTGGNVRVRSARMGA